VTEWRGKASATRNKVEEARANQSENRSQNNVLDSLTRMKDAGRIEGFHVSLIPGLNWPLIFIVLFSLASRDDWEILELSQTSTMLPFPQPVDRT
jgi:hypothetical protein